MTRRVRLRLLIPATVLAAAATAMMLAPRPGDGCGPLLPEAVFVVTRHPDSPDSAFAAGRLGVIQPTWYQRYLYVAWRNLRGLASPPLEPVAHRTGGPDRAATAWIEARRQVPDLPAVNRIDPYAGLESSNGWAWFESIHADAFRTAIATLDARIARFGAGSPEVRDWVLAQDRVFESARDSLVPPEPAAPDAPALVRADRAYQTAAAEFYAGDFDAAAAGFDAIAADAESPWHTIAPYLVARALTRKGTLDGSEGAPDTAALARAVQQLDRVIADPGLASMHEAARGLRDFVRFRLEPRARLRELCVALSGPRPSAQDLEDLTTLLDHFRQTEVESLATADPAYDLADWILTLQSGWPGAHRHALARSAVAPHWTAVAMAHARGADPEASALIAAAADVKPDDPAYPTLTWHRVRLMIESGRGDEARATLDALLAGPRTPWPPSSWNLLRAARLSLARTLESFLAFTPREPAGVSYGMPFEGYGPDSAELAARAYPGSLCMDADAAARFRHALPLDLLARIARGSELPDNLRAEVAFSSWVRAVLLERDAVAQGLAPVVASLIPALAARFEVYTAAPDADARRFAAADLMLHAPGARPAVMTGLGRPTPVDQSNPFRDNWWCATGGGTDLPFARGPFAVGPWSTPEDTVTAGFIDQAARAAAAAETARLARIPAGPTWLARETIAWAEGHADDPRVPEALHLAVDATHYGCPDRETSELSRRAFQILHRRYPESTWARQTPYWY